MDVFISWSGDYSRRVAVALAEWLPAVLQRVKPFVSDKDIHSGARWQTEVTGQLDASSFGVLIVTSDNQKSPWLQFEAGALSKSVQDSRVVPLLVDLPKSELILPLNMFQAETLDQPGVESLLQSMNESTEVPLPEATTKALADKWWPDLKAQLSKAKPERVVGLQKPQRTERELLEELITMVRFIRNDMAHRADPEADEALVALREKLTKDHRRSALRRRSMLQQFAAELERAGAKVVKYEFTNPNEVTFDLAGSHVPEEVADEVASRAIDMGLNVWIKNIGDTATDLFYGDS